MPEVPVASSSKRSKNDYSGPQSAMLALQGELAARQSSQSNKGPLKGVAAMRKAKSLALSKDKFIKPSPNVAKRIAQQQQNEAKRALWDEEVRMTEDDRQRIMAEKAAKYARQQRGEEVPDAESSVDFQRKRVEEHERKSHYWSDHSSDEDESAKVPDALRHKYQDPFEALEAASREVEYIDEMGRTRRGTAAEAEAANRQRENTHDEPTTGEAHAEVLQSKVIYGAQSFFPVYEPTQEELQRRHREAAGGPLVDRYDATKEIRAQGAAYYKFSRDEDERADQQAQLKARTEETRRARELAGLEENQLEGSAAAVEGYPASEGVGQRPSLPKEQEPAQSSAARAMKRKRDERMAQLKAKRENRLGGTEAVENLRKQQREREAEALLKSIQDELQPTTGDQ